MSLGHALPVSCWGNCDPQASCSSCPGSLQDATRRAEDRDYLGYLVGQCSGKPGSPSVLLYTGQYRASDWLQRKASGVWRRKMTLCRQRRDAPLLG